MKKQRWGGILVTFLKENILSLGLFVAVFCLLLSGLASTKAGSRQEELEIVQESITRAVVSCYAIEGRYPENLSYLQENYGLQVNPNKFFVQYSIFASNIMPEITVIEVGT